MSCRINLNERGEVESVNTPEGKISQVFNELAQKFGTEKALELYSVTDDEAFKYGQEVKKSLQKERNKAKMSPIGKVLNEAKEYALRRTPSSDMNSIIEYSNEIMKKVQYAPGYFAKTIREGLDRLIYVPINKTTSYDNNTVTYEYFPKPNKNVGITEIYRSWDEERKFPEKVLYDSTLVDKSGNIIDDRYKSIEDSSLWINSGEYDENFIYRGMSSAELQDAIRNGYIKSNASMNLGGQEETTSFAQHPSQARNYAHGFTASHDTVTFNNPKYIIKVKKEGVNYKPAMEREPKNEVNVFGSINISAIESIYEIRLASTNFGMTQLRDDKYKEDVINQGSGGSMNQEAVAREVKISEVGLEDEENMSNMEINSILFSENIGEEPSIEDIINYATQQEVELSVQDEIDLSNAMYSLGLTHYGQVETLIESNLVKDGVLVFTEKNLKSSGLYNTYEINYILNNIEAQYNIRRVLQALKTIENKEVPEVNKLFLVTTSKINILGKQEVLNPFIVEEEVTKAIAGKDLNIYLDDIPYDSIKNNYYNSRNTKWELDNITERNRNIQAKKIENGQLVDKTTNNNKELFKKTIDFSNKDVLLSKIYYLSSITPEVWAASSDEVYELLKDLNKVAIDAGIDMQDLEAKLFIKSQGEILSFLRETSNLLEEPTEENMNDFSNKYSEFFNVVDEPITQTVKTKDDTNVYLDTDLSEFELFNKYGLLKESGNIYKEITPLESLDTAYEVLFSNKDKIPYSIETIEELKNYVNKIVSEYETEDFNVNQEGLENLIIHKIYFGTPLKFYKSTDRSGRVRMSVFNTDYKYITENYPSDFYKEYLTEKRLGSEEFVNFYSNFMVGERGITLKNSDPITINNIKMYMGEALSQYNIVSKHLNIPIEEEVDSPVVEDMQYNREYAISNPASVPKIKGDFIKISDKTIAVRNEVRNIIKTPAGLYELDYQSGDVMFYNKLPEGDTNYYSYGQHKSKTFSDVNVMGYSAMEITPENFIAAKNYYTKKELEEINKENFNCK